MARRHQPVLQRSFSSGQIDENVVGRSDAAVYDSAVRLSRNWLPFAAGGIRYRPGSEIKRTFSGARRLSFFVFSNSQTYTFAFSNGQVEVSDGLTGAAVVTVGSAPWVTADIYEMRVSQRGDTMIVTHENFYPQVIKRTGASTFTLANFVFEAHTSGWPKKEPFYKFADPAVTLTPSATTGSINLTASAASFTAAHVGSILRYKKKQIEITGYTSTTILVGTVRETLSGTTADTEWDENIVSARRGYPRSVCFHGQRLVFGGTSSLPLHVLISKSAAFFNFDVGTALADEAIVTPIGADVSTIYDVISLNTLVAITDVGPFHFPESNTSPLTPANANPIRINTEGGVITGQAVRYKDAVLYAGKPDGNVVSSLRYNPLEQGYEWATSSLLFRDFVNEIKQSAVVEKPFGSVESFAIFLNDDGSMEFFHSIPEEKLQGWFPYTTAGTVHGVCATDDRVWLCVERSINGTPTYFLELMDEDFTLDGAVRVTTALADTFAGFGNLASQEVAVVASGVDADAVTLTNAFAMGDFTVDAGGNIDISSREYECTTLTAGFEFPSTDLELLPPVVRSQEGEWVGKNIKVARVILRLKSSLAITVGTEALILRQTQDDFSLATSPTTAQHQFWQLGWGKEGSIPLSVMEPLPCELLYVLRQVVYTE